jgi:threonine dehydrogenase-like Zn-dependent dehydrogenase
MISRIRRIASTQPEEQGLTDEEMADMRLTDGRGVDVAIEALGTQATFEACCGCSAPAARSRAWASTPGPHHPARRLRRRPGRPRIVTTLCPGGKERMRRLMGAIASGRIDLRPMVTHRFPLERIGEAYDPFARQRDGC